MDRRRRQPSCRNIDISFFGDRIWKGYMIMIKSLNSQLVSRCLVLETALLLSSSSSSPPFVLVMGSK